MKNRLEYFTRKMFFNQEAETKDEKEYLRPVIRSGQYITEGANQWNQGILKAVCMRKVPAKAQVDSIYPFCVIPTLSEQNDKWNRALLSLNTVKKKPLPVREGRQHNKSLKFAPAPLGSPPDARRLAKSLGRYESINGGIK